MAKHKARETSRLLIDEHPLQVLPTLALTIGLNEAIILQQVHYWLGHSEHIYDGKPWIYNSYEDWHKQFPWWGIATIRRTIYRLEAMGLLEATSRYNRHAHDPSKWYSINMEKLKEIESGAPDQNDQAPDQNDQAPDQNDQAPDQNDQPPCSDRSPPCSDRSQSQRFLPEISPEIGKTQIPFPEIRSSETGPEPSTPVGTGVCTPGRGGEGTPPLPPPQLSHVLPADLTDTGRLLVLWHQASRQGLIGRTQPDRLTLVALAEHACRVGTDPPALFAQCLRLQAWHVISDQDDVAAHTRLTAYDRGTPLDRAPPLALPEDWPEDPDADAGDGDAP